MTWNGNGGSGPWGPSNRPPPPDLDKMFEMARRKVEGKLPGRRLWGVLGLLAFVLWMATGIYVVGPDEQGVVVRFGRFVDTTGPGPHFHLPFPIEAVYKPKVTAVQRIEIGYRSRERSVSVDVSAESLMLTGDENIIDIDATVQYRIKDAAEYLFNVRSPPDDSQKVVRNAAETAIRAVIGRNSIDEALTAGKDLIQTETQNMMQDVLDGYRSGIQIMNVQLQQVAPPSEVIHAFKDVASAREDRERAINEAQGYANDILPKAKGEAAQMVQQAEAYKVAKISRAEGDVRRYEALRVEFEKARDVTVRRLYLETMEQVLPGMKKVIIDPATGGHGVLPLLPLSGTATLRPEEVR
ncbi:MAG: FtsH protease activity modulator HflK [Magnetococcus sp. WYHC-3]